MIFLKLKLNKLRRASAPDATFKAALRSRLLAGGEQQYIVHRFSTPMLRYAFATSALALVLLFGVSSYAYASSSVTSGDSLYPLKTGIEDIEGSLKKSPEAQARFRARMLDRRAREIAYRLRHDEPLRRQDLEILARAMNLSVTEFKDLAGDEGGRELIKTDIKLQLITSLTQFRTQIELAEDLSDEQKDAYFQVIDKRLEALEKVSTTAPLE